MEKPLTTTPKTVLVVSLTPHSFEGVLSKKQASASLKGTASTFLFLLILIVSGTCTLLKVHDLFAPQSRSECCTSKPVKPVLPYNFPYCLSHLLFVTPVNMFLSRFSTLQRLQADPRRLSSSLAC